MAIPASTEAGPEETGTGTTCHLGDGETDVLTGMSEDDLPGRKKQIGAGREGQDHFAGTHRLEMDSQLIRGSVVATQASTA